MEHDKWFVYVLYIQGVRGSTSQRLRQVWEKERKGRSNTDFYKQHNGANFFVFVKWKWPSIFKIQNAIFMYVC